MRVNFSKSLFFFYLATLLLAQNSAPLFLRRPTWGTLPAQSLIPERHCERSKNHTHACARRRAQDNRNQSARRVRVSGRRTRHLQSFCRGSRLRHLRRENIAIRSGQTQKLDISLAIQVEKQEVQVSDDAAKIDVNPSSNAGAITITEKDLDAFSDDPDELEAQLTALTTLPRVPTEASST